MQTQITAMPEMDWLTGLSSRAAFSRQVNQADRDRDRFAIALLEVNDFGEINRRLDYETGDELLRVIGRALAFQTSVNTFAARVGGARFAILTIQHGAGDLQPWVTPIVSAVNEAIASWTFDLIDYTGDCPVEPELRAGVATGYSGRVWSDAAIALELAQTDPLGGSVVLHDAEDPRFLARRRQQRLADRIVAELTSGSLQAGGRRIEVVGGQDPDWRWLRLGAVEPDHAAGTDRSRTPNLIDTSLVPAGVEQQLESWMIEQAGRVLTESDSQLRVTVPIAREITGGRAFAQRLFSNLERFRIPPSRMLFEVPEAAMVQAGPVGREFSRQLDRIGSGLVIADCEGGWGAWLALEDQPILFVKPSGALVARAGRSEAAACRILTTIADNAAAADRELIAPPSSTDDSTLGNFGFAYRELAEPQAIRV